VPTLQGAPLEETQTVQGVIGQWADVAFLEREAGYDGMLRGGAALVTTYKGRSWERGTSAVHCLHHRHTRSVCPSLRSVGGTKVPPLPPPFGPLWSFWSFSYLQGLY